MSSKSQININKKHIEFKSAILSATKPKNHTFFQESHFELTTF